MQIHAQADSIKELSRFSLHFQSTIINQYKLPFNAKYSGQNSLSDKEENRISITSTLFAGMRLWKHSSVFINPELAGGEGLSQTLGLAGATNGETFRIGNPKPSIYLARLFFQQLINLNTGKKDVNPNIDHFKGEDFNQVEDSISDVYLNFVIGKISIADYFDDNSFAHDPRTEFMNWALMASAGWDYPANTRGYTPSAVVELFSKKWEARAGVSMVPKEANGNIMDENIHKAHSITTELVRNFKLWNKPGTIRFLGFYTTARMGNYIQATNDSAPDITKTRQYGRTKYGWAINIEQFLNEKSGIFLKYSWNDGKNETWAFTEIDRSLCAGISWFHLIPKADDNIALAYVVNGISNEHQQYLKKGGLGFMLGDGNLNYGYEHILEFYYKIALKKNNIYLTADYQFILNPGYNKDRSGPVNVFSIRTHIRL